MCAGAHGAIASSAHVLPEWHVRIHTLLRDGRLADARACRRCSRSSRRSSRSRTPPVKAVLAAQGWCEDGLRLPFVPASEGLRSGWRPFVRNWTKSSRTSRQHEPRRHMTCSRPMDFAPTDCFKLSERATGHTAQDGHRPSRAEAARDGPVPASDRMDHDGGAADHGPRPHARPEPVARESRSSRSLGSACRRRYRASPGRP